MERARLDDGVDELAMLRECARLTFAVCPLSASFRGRAKVPQELAFCIVRYDGVKFSTMLNVISEADAKARVARLNEPLRADGFHRWN